MSAEKNILTKGYISPYDRFSPRYATVDRFNYRRRSLSNDTYDHIRRRRFSGDFGRSRRHSGDRDMYNRLPRRRSPSPDDIYSRPRRHSIEGPPSDYFRSRRRSDDYGLGASRYGRVIRRTSYDGVLPSGSGRMRRHYSDPYLNYSSYGRPVMPVRSGYTVYSQPGYTQQAYTRFAPQPVVKYVRRPPPAVQYIDAPVQYVQRPQQIQYIQPRPTVQAIQHVPPPVQYIQRPIPAPVQYVEQRPITRQIRYVQQPVVEPRVIVQEPVVERSRYTIEGKLTPIDVGPSTVHVKYNNVNTDYVDAVMPSRRNGVRDLEMYETQPIQTGNTYTAFVLGKDGAARMLEDRYLGNINSPVENGYSSDYRNGSRGKELDHVLYFGHGKTKEIYDDADWNNNNNNYSKSRIIR